MVNTIRQGDINFRKVDVITPNGMDKVSFDKKLNGFPLAYGEGAGHVHLLRPETEDVTISVFGLPDQEQFIQIKGGNALLRHEKEGTFKTAEHKQIVIPEGTYSKKQEREFDPFTEMERQVAD